MKESLKKTKKGFTLMEMLIVVAIIAILVVIAIPTFTNALEDARANTDLANTRAWYAEVVLDAMLNDGTLTGEFTSVATYPNNGKTPWGDKFQSKHTILTVTGTTLETFTVTVFNEKAGINETFNR